MRTMRTMRRGGAGGFWRLGSALLLGWLARSAAAQPAGEPDLVRQVEIRRTTYGVPHITAENLAALGFGIAWCQLEDYGGRVAHNLLRARGELALRFGPDSVNSDFDARRRFRRALETYHLVSPDARALYEGFAQGVNWYLRLHPFELSGPPPPTFTGHDVHALYVFGADARDAQPVLRRLGPEVASSGAAEDGSNAWVFAPARTRSGRAILLRNPHLSWGAGYYEVHLVVPGRLNFYGDIRIGYPLWYIGGFNEHLGWATTNNSFDSEEVYALDADRERPDHYRFDGRAIPLTTEEVTVEFRHGKAIGRATRTFLTTPLGPVVHRAEGTIYVLRSASDGEYRLADQYLGMIQARTMDDWLAAMRIRAHPGSNFLYADGGGNILYLWNARLPARPHEPGGDTTAVRATRSEEIWTTLVPFDSLPMLRNPESGYLHNENDPFHFTTLGEPFDSTLWGSGYPRPDLRLRSQLALDLIDGAGDSLTLEQVVALKHSPRMLLAERVKADLDSAVRASAPDSTLLAALAVLQAWDNTTRPEARGGVLFAAWFQRYTAALRKGAPPTPPAPPDGPAPEPFAIPWSAAEPVTTPRGLADPGAAVTAFREAVRDTRRRFGRVDIAWGEVYRVRRGRVDVPVAGCPGVLGCFRTLNFRAEPDGKLAVSGGDGWILAVEFQSPPRAYSVLAYGQSARLESPHYDDQAEAFARGELKPVAFTEADIEASVIRRYRPGRESSR